MKHIPNSTLWRWFYQYRLDIAVLAVFTVMLVIVFARNLFWVGRMAYEYDIKLFYAFEAAWRQGVLEGQFPQWVPFFGGGMPMVAMPQTAFMYPAKLLFGALPIPAMLNWSGFVHLWLAGIGIYLMLRDRRFAVSSAILGSVVFVFSGAVIPRFNAGLITLVYILAWTGWIDLVYRRMLRTGRWIYLILTTAFAWLIAVAGHPQYSLIVLAVPGSTFVVFALEQIRKRAWRALLWAVAQSLLVAILAAGLAAPQLLPAYELFSQSPRASGLDFDDATSFGMTPAHLTSLFVPLLLVDLAVYLGVDLRFELVHEMSPYVGVITLVLASMTLVHGGRDRRSLKVQAVALALLGLLLALAEYTPVYWLLFQVIKIFRAPGRFLLWWAYGFSILAAYGLETVVGLHEINRESLARWLRFTRNISLILLVFTAVELFTPLKHILVFSWLPQVVTLVILACLAHAGTASNISTGAWKWLIPVGIALEMSIFAWVLLPPVEVSKSIAGAESPYRLLEINPAEVRIGSDDRQAAVNLVPTFIGDAPPAINTLEGLYELGLDGGRGSQLMAAGYVVSAFPSSKPGLTLVKEVEGAYLYEYDTNWPRIYAVPAVQVVSSSAEAFALVSAAGFDPLEKVVVTSGSQRPDLPGEAPLFSQQNVRITCYEMNRVCADVRVDNPAMIVFAEMYYPGWSAVVNGQPAPVWQANYTLRGVVVETGDSQIEMQYTSRMFSMGKTIALSTLAFIAVVTLLLNITRNRRRKS